MPTSKDTNDSYEEKGRGRVACSTKDKEKGTGGRMVKFVVAFFHGRGMIECFRYEGNINEELFLQFVRDRFPHVFSKRNNQKGKLFLQDGGTSNNCKMSQESMDKISYRLFMTPSRSPDLNTIENIFHFIGMCLRKDGFMKKIKRETYEQFCNCITNTLQTFHQIS